MSKRHIYKSYPEALDALAEKLRSRTFDAGVYHIVLTPDRYTLMAEKALFKNGGALDCEVLTLSRLTRRVLGNVKTLSREGCVMLTARAIAAVSDKLTYYRRAARYTDFARGVYDALLQIGSSAVTPRSVLDSLGGSAHGAAAQKLADLAVIKEEYDRLKGESLDAPDRLSALIAAAKDSPLIKNSRFYAIGYADSTELMNGVFSAIERYARSFEMYLDELHEPLGNNVQVYRADDDVSEYKLVAADIRDYVYGGGRYGDVAIVCPEPRALTRILNEYGIDYYTDNSVPLYDTPPATALRLLFDLVSEGRNGAGELTGGDGAKAVALAKNPFSGVAPEDAEALSDYLVSHGIAYGVFSAEVKGKRAARAIDRLKKLAATFMSGDGFADGCEKVIEECGLEDIAQELTDRVKHLSGDCDVLLTDMITPLGSLVGLVREYGSGDMAVDSAMFFSAARSVDVKSVPHYSDRVTVCLPESLRMTACKRLYITDFNEGVLPVPTADAGLIGDADIRDTGDIIKPTVREKNRRSREEIKAIIDNAERVLCTYRTDGGGRRAALLTALCGGREKDQSDLFAKLKVTDDPELIARYACASAPAREIAARRLTAHSEDIANAVGGADCAQPFSPYVSARPHRSISVSELTRWFYCPYSRFLTYAVGLNERKTMELSAPDFGLLMHAFMEEFAKEKYYLLPEKELRERARASVEKLMTDSERTFSRADSERIARDAEDYAVLNAELIRAGGFLPDPEHIEYAFSGELELGRAGVPFKGKIDRVDRGSTGVRIIDYKTGGKKFDTAKCADGRDMQLPLYAAALKKSENVVGMFYVPMRSLYELADKNDKYLMAGRLVKSYDVAVEMDASTLTGKKSALTGARINTEKGELAGHSGQMLQKDRFDALIDGCVETASLAVDEIDSGYIDRSPAVSACEKCAFSGLCDKRSVRTGTAKNSENKAGGAARGEGE